MFEKPFNLLSAFTTVIRSSYKSTARSISYLALGTSIAVMPTFPNPATAAVNPTVTNRGTAIESSLLARAIRRPFQGAPAPAWRHRCEMETRVVGYKQVQALTNPKSRIVLTQLGPRLVRSNGLKTETVPITRRVRACRTR